MESTVFRKQQCLTQMQNVFFWTRAKLLLAMCFENIVVSSQWNAKRGAIQTRGSGKAWQHHVREMDPSAKAVHTHTHTPHHRLQEWTEEFSPGWLHSVKDCSSVKDPWVKWNIRACPSETSSNGMLLMKHILPLPTRQLPGPELQGPYPNPSTITKAD